jgi:hypothetical protein
MHIDFGVGDTVTPQNITMHLVHDEAKPLFEKEIELWAYPIEVILAEKLQTVIARGAQNSRMKDYHDLLTLLRSGELNASKSKSAVKTTFEHRNTSLGPIIFNREEITILQGQWLNYRRKMKPEVGGLHPNSIDQAISEINKLLGSHGILEP